MDARAHQGKWLLRIDDSDILRNINHANEQIQETLFAYGLIWDGKIVYQHQHAAYYANALETLKNNHLTFPCVCSRKQLSGLKRYPGNCRNNSHVSPPPYSIRIKSRSETICFVDKIQSKFCQHVANQHGDFIIKRKDEIIAYQLAVVVDDFTQQINHVVRGFDLIDSTIKQIYLQNLLNYPTPNYCHVPIITNQYGEKLSKQTLAESVSTKNPQKTLFLLLELLKQQPPSNLKSASVQDMLTWAINHWSTRPLKKIRAICS